MNYNGTYYHYLYNGQGDVVKLIDGDGASQVEYTYDTWGACTATGSMANTLGAKNPFRYRGYVYDTETRLYYLESRYYDPETGRFISSDTLMSTGQSALGYNMFAYCGNNPVVREDIGGELWDTIFDVISLIGSIADVVDNPSDVTTWLCLLGDVADVLIPCVGGLGEVTRVVTKADDVVDVVKTIDKGSDLGKTTKKLRRPYIRKQTREAVERSAKRLPDGRFLDANLRTPINGKYDLGHKYGREFWRERDKAMARGWTQKKFNEYMNDPSMYQIEDPFWNRSHRFEMRR